MTKNIYLNVPFSEKDEAKKAGAKWDNQNKKWLVPNGKNLKKFEKWLNNKEFYYKNFNNQVFDYKKEFKLALEKLGLILEDDPIMNGKIQRVPVIGDKGKATSGSYVGFELGHPAGYIQNYKSGEKENWKSSQIIKKINLPKKLNEENIDKERNLEEIYEKTSIKLQDEFINAKYAFSKHPYLVKKGFNTNFYLKQDDNGNLLIPLKDINGKHWASQRIFKNGDKIIGVTRTKEEKENNIKYLSRKKGTFYLFGSKSISSSINEIFICEGFATAATVYQAMNKPTIMGVDAGNLEIVVNNLIEKFPNIKIIIASDNDIKKELENKVNVGKDTALKIQKKFPNIKIVSPIFSKNEIEKGLSDFNDLYLYRNKNLQEVKKQIENQLFDI